ncbi:AAA family ATPase [Saccharolobus sp. E5-1-F]|uniref:AAA family ATPase n=1 Tax=Saccharolobus sp. E5-1-F TaxID=2663019 RepID=UPI00210F933E|nr:ATP-binding protein [Sulfolobus sp. E5-1-F]
MIGGQREIGKTSLMKVVINEIKKREQIPGIYINLRGVRSLNSLLFMLVSEINKEKISWRFKVNINFLITSAGIEIRGGSKGRVVNSLIELLNSSDDIVIAFDEVQELSFASKQFLDVLGNVYATNPKVHIILSGSYVGLVKALLSPPSDSPLHGRPPTEIRLKPFDKEKSIYFLEKGMQELGIRFNRHDEVIEKLDGIVGWLTLFGNFHVVRKLDFEIALRETIGEGKKIMLEEFNHFLSNKENKQLYCNIMNVLKLASKWKDIKNGVEIRMGKVDDKVFSNALQNLVNFNFVSKVDDEYKIVDPMLKEINFNKC